MGFACAMHFNDILKIYLLFFTLYLHSDPCTVMTTKRMLLSISNTSKHLVFSLKACRQCSNPIPIKFYDGNILCESNAARNVYNMNLKHHVLHQSKIILLQQKYIFSKTGEVRFEMQMRCTKFFK